jgi:hypothetical protein
VPSPAISPKRESNGSGGCGPPKAEPTLKKQADNTESHKWVPGAISPSVGAPAVGATARVGPRACGHHGAALRWLRAGKPIIRGGRLRHLSSAGLRWRAVLSSWRVFLKGAYQDARLTAGEGGDTAPGRPPPNAAPVAQLLPVARCDRGPDPTSQVGRVTLVDKKSVVNGPKPVWKRHGHNAETDGFAIQDR